MTDSTNFTGIRLPRLPPSRASYVGHEQKQSQRSCRRRHFMITTIRVHFRPYYFSLLIQFHSRKMANVHGLFSGPKDDDSSDEERESRFVGGISARGGGRCVSHGSRIPARHCCLTTECTTYLPIGLLS